MSDLTTGNIAEFNFYSAIFFLIIKLFLKSITRGLAKGDGKSVLIESVSSFGMDLAIVGFSLLLGGLISNRVKLSGINDGLCLLVVVIGLVFSTLFYGLFHKSKKGIMKFIYGTISWILGIIPFGTGLYVLLIFRS